MVIHTIVKLLNNSLSNHDTLEHLKIMKTWKQVIFGLCQDFSTPGFIEQRDA